MRKNACILAAITAGLFSACDNTTEEIGTSLVQNESEVIIESSFNITGHTTVNQRVQSRTITQILGRIDAEGYGRFSSDFVTQFMPAATLDTDGVTAADIDSMKLEFAIPLGGFVGDSIAPMELEVYRLNKQLPYPIYSDFNPSEYYATSDLLASKAYTYNVLGESDAIQALSYRSISVDMPLTLARELFTLYQTNPEAYTLPSEFAKHFPGIYVKNSYGTGRVVRIASTVMRMYYHTTTTDSEGEESKTSKEGVYYAVTPEIITNNNIAYSISSDLENRINSGEQIVIAPAGRDVEMEFPAIDIIKYYEENSGSLSVVNSLTFSIPAEEITNDYGITPPETLLLILSNQKDKFFLNSEVTDSKSSFVANYNATANAYVFSGMRAYLLDVLDKYHKNGTLDPTDYTFTATPISISTESSTSGYNSTTYVSAITPYVLTPAMVRLDLSKATITLTFSKQTTK